MMENQIIKHSVFAMQQQIENNPRNDLIPDACNVGVLFRILFVVNLTVLLGLFSRGSEFAVAIQQFLESAALLEFLTLISAFSLCTLRRHLRAGYWPAWLQRLTCAVVPVLWLNLLILLFAQQEWMREIFPRLRVDWASAVSLLLGIVLQQYFELRNLAYSPAINEARLQALQARIRPHFLFNSLNTALALIRHEPRKAETVLEDLSDLFRVLMRETRNMTSLEDELRLCKQYLAIEQLRLGSRMRVDWDYQSLSDESLKKIQLPSLLLQPLLENAVHYGVEPAEQVAQIGILLRNQFGKLIIEIRNPVHPTMAAPSGNQMALENIRQRLNLLYDVEAHLEHAIINQEFIVNLEFPVQKR